MPNSAAAHALTLAYIFPTSKAALRCAQDMRSYSREPFNILEKEEVYRSFVRHKGNLKAVARELGWNPSVLSHTSTFVLPSMHRNSLIAPAIRDVIHSNVSLEEAALRHRVSADKLGYLLNRGGDLLRAAIKEIDRRPCAART
jgi:hypothetical protein